MLTVDLTGILAKTITPSMGLTDTDVLGIRTSMRRFVGEWKTEREQGGHGWSRDIYNQDMVQNVKDIAAKAKKDRIETIVWIGIGGSGLGPRVIQEVFETPQTAEIIIIDTIDPAALQMYLEIIDWKKALIVVASKSGGTLETISAFFLYWDTLRQVRGLGAAERVIALTDGKTGWLHDFSIEQGITILPIPEDTGGRYSIFTAVGLLPLALLGADVDRFIEGAIDMDERCRNDILEENPAAMLAAAQYLLDSKKGYLMRVIMPYAHRLQNLARWNQQLVAESLGKNEVSNPFPVAAIGSQDQHSMLQQWMQGPRKAWHLFIREVEKPRVFIPQHLPDEWAYIAGKSFGQLVDAFCDGTSMGLASVKRPSVMMSVTRLDEYHLAQLFYCLLAEVILLGKLYRVDPYGQPGVEASKTIAKEILMHGRSE